MNDLETYFNNNTGRVMDKWMHYFEVYDRHFSKYRGKDIVILEIGTWHGGSLQMWKSYFGDKAKIYGMDINPDCKNVEEENVKVFIGSQSDRDFLRKVKSELPPLDILIDDGGHTMLQQIVTFEELFDHVKPDGVYLCEDMHTSYWTRWGGGFKRKGSFIEYTKSFIDKLNAFNSRERSLKADSFTHSVDSLHFYDSMLVIEKKPREAPAARQTGEITLSGPQPEYTGLALVKLKARYMYRRKMNRLLNFFGLPFKNGDMIQ
jgi:SAM-dependent methyltransferase